MSAVSAWVDANPGYAAVAAMALPFALVDFVVFGALAVRWLKPRPVATAVVATLAAIVLPLAVVAATSPPASADEPQSCTFVSMPDFLNADVGDTRQLPAWDKGDPNSTNAKYRESIKRILDNVAAQEPDAVLVAGDLVEGHWGADVEGTRLFGKVRTREQRLAALRRAGDFYYGEWAERFAARDLRVLTAIGDHEIGDNPWSGKTSRTNDPAGTEFKRSAFPVFKHTWAREFTLGPAGRNIFRMRPAGTRFEDTAYATYVCDGVLLVTVDVFSRGGGDVHARLGAGQLAWVDRVLAKTGAHTVLVQGHTPVLGPVNNTCSSSLMYLGGKASPFWQTLVKHDNADTNVVYLNGEVHDVTALEDSGVTQISHGGLINCGGTNYLRGDVYPDGRMDLELHRFHADVGADKPELWATTWKRPNADVLYHRGTTVEGTMTFGPAGTLAAATGELAVSR